MYNYVFRVIFTQNMGTRHRDTNSEETERHIQSILPTILSY